MTLNIIDLQNSAVNSEKCIQPIVKDIGSCKNDSKFSLDIFRELYLEYPSGISFTQDQLSMNYDPSKKTLPTVRYLHRDDQKRILVTGGAGFVGSHLVDRLMKMGHLVIVVDNLFTGNMRNIAHWVGHPNFEFVRHDIIDHFKAEVDQIYHLACPASPPDYQYNAIKTIKCCVMGTMNMLGLAKRTNARFLLASTSEIYGDPKESPQKESYWGNVNPIGPRACYDEGKRAAETLTYCYASQEKVDVRVVRIFNTYGPRMNPSDGRVVSNFIVQGEDMTIYGDGSHTRSFQYVHDLVDGLIDTMNGGCTEPMNLGNPSEFTISKFAELVKARIKSRSKIVNLDAKEDDPRQRRPDISKAWDQIGWIPRFSLEQGLDETIEYFTHALEND